MKRLTVVLVLLAGCVKATEPHPLPPCERIPWRNQFGEIMGYTYRIDYIGKIPLCAVPK